MTLADEWGVGAGGGPKCSQKLKYLFEWTLIVFLIFSLLPESLQSHPDYLHLLAQYNRHLDIRHFADSSGSDNDIFIQVF
jgi:hypothetical protein